MDPLYTPLAGTWTDIQHSSNDLDDLALLGISLTPDPGDASHRNYSDQALHSFPMVVDQATN